MKRILLLLLSVSCLLFPLYPAVSSGDLSYLYDFLEKSHPDFYNSLSESEARTILDEEIVKTGMNPDDEVSFFFSLQHIASIPHDSHTGMMLTSDLFYKMSAFPVVFDFFSDDLVVTTIESSHSAFLAGTVESVNGVGVDEIIGRAAGIIPHDNDVYLKLQLKNNYLSFAQFYSAIGIDADDMTLSFADGTSLTLEKIPYEQFVSTSFAYLRQSYPDTLGQGSYYSAYALPDPDTLLINYHACAEMPNFPFRDFVTAVSDLIDENGYSRIVIDLRYNGGGNSEVINPLIDVLKEKDAGVFVLIDEGTFSSAVLNALTLKEELGAVFAGRPSGGSASHYGELKSGTLPYSAMAFSYSTKFFDNGVSGPLMPDILIEKDIDDYRNGIDTDLRVLGFLEE